MVLWLSSCCSVAASVIALILQLKQQSLCLLTKGLCCFLYTSVFSHDLRLRVARPQLRAAGPQLRAAGSQLRAAMPWLVTEYFCVFEFYTVGFLHFLRNETRFYPNIPYDWLILKLSIRYILHFGANIPYRKPNGYGIFCDFYSLFRMAGGRMRHRWNPLCPTRCGQKIFYKIFRFF